MDCATDPDNCSSEKLIKNIIDEMVSGGYKDAGYEYLYSPIHKTFIPNRHNFYPCLSAGPHVRSPPCRHP